MYMFERPWGTILFHWFVIVLEDQRDEKAKGLNHLILLILQGSGIPDPSLRGCRQACHYKDGVVFLPGLSQVKFLSSDSPPTKLWSPRSVQQSSLHCFWLRTLGNCVRACAVGQKVARLACLQETSSKVYPSGYVLKSHVLGSLLH